MGFGRQIAARISSGIAENETNGRMVSAPTVLFENSKEKVGIGRPPIFRSAARYTPSAFLGIVFPSVFRYN